MSAKKWISDKFTSGPLKGFIKSYLRNLLTNGNFDRKVTLLCNSISPGNSSAVSLIQVHGLRFKFLHVSLRRTVMKYGKSTRQRRFPSFSKEVNSRLDLCHICIKMNKSD